MENTEFWKGRKVLVTGGAGMIGSHLVERLVELRAYVTVVDNLSRGRTSNLKKVRPQIIFWNADVTDSYVAEQVMHDQEVVFNLAAKVTGIHYNISHHATMFAENALLQIVPLKAACKEGVERFIQVSTACVLPHDCPVPTPEEYGWKGEPEPTNQGYGWAKRIGERYAVWAAQEFGVKTGIVRFWNAYGPRDYFDWESSHVIPAFIRKALEHDKIVIWGSGKQKRSFVHAADIARCLCVVADKIASTDPEPLNIGHDEQIDMLSLARLILDILGIDKPIECDTTKPDGYPERAADVSKLRRLTGGWIPHRPLREGLEETIQWYLANKDEADGTGGGREGTV